MVSGNEVADDGRQVAALGQLDAFGDVADDDLRRFNARHLVQRIHTSLILGEERWVLHLTDVMVESSRTHQLRVGINPVCNGRGQVTDHDGVLERAGCHLAELEQQVLAGVRQFDERHVGDEAEGLLHDEHQRIGEEQQYAVDDEVLVHVVVHRGDAVVLHQLQGKVHSSTGNGHEQGRAEELRPLRQFAQGIDGGETGHQFDDDEFVLVFHGGCADENHHRVRDEGRP